MATPWALSPRAGDAKRSHYRRDVRRRSRRHIFAHSVSGISSSSSAEDANICGTRCAAQWPTDECRRRRVQGAARLRLSFGSDGAIGRATDDRGLGAMALGLTRAWQVRPAGEPTEARALTGARYAHRGTRRTVWASTTTGLHSSLRDAKARGPWAVTLPSRHALVVGGLPPRGNPNAAASGSV